MKGDFTRDTFQPDKHYQQVLMQQGRVQLDADWNEQSAIAARRDETMLTDLAGRCGGPAESAGFRISTDAALPGDLLLSAGRYYVQGVQCELEQDARFTQQPDRHGQTPLSAGQYLIYLDVWRRHVTMHEDGGIREAALGGPDTGTRVKTIWQVRAAALDAPLDPDNPPPDPCHQAANEFDQRPRAVLPRLAAKTADATPDSDPCTVPASAGYRGLENQLYRVEIHAAGSPGHGHVQMVARERHRRHASDEQRGGTRRRRGREPFDGRQHRARRQSRLQERESRRDHSCVGRVGRSSRHAGADR